jgi:hypothetical protein
MSSVLNDQMDILLLSGCTRVVLEIFLLLVNENHLKHMAQIN